MVHQTGLRGKIAFLPGEISRWSAEPTVGPVTVPRSLEKSAEAVVPEAVYSRREGPNVRKGTEGVRLDR